MHSCIVKKRDVYILSILFIDLEKEYDAGLRDILWVAILT